MSRLLLLLVLACLPLGACLSALPQESSSAALHRDLERLVSLGNAEGWTVDRIEVEETLPDALSSVCRTTPGTRQDLLGWLNAQIAAKGGSAREAYEARGRDLDAIEDLLLLTRIRMLLVRSLEVGEADCPFWMQPKEHFGGRQILDGRWLLSVGGGGKAIGVRQAGESDLNFGGAGRIVIGRAIGPHATLFAGLEAGGSASFPKNAAGERGDIALAVDVVAPLIYRHRLVNSYWEVEGGYVAHLEEGQTEPAHGAHLGVSLGGSGKRRRWLFPGAAFGISYEQIRADDTLHVVKMGFRVVIDLAR
jgi:hypothetical protein